MAVMTNDQPIVGAYGDAYTAPPGTDIPSDIDAPGAEWTLLGMISEDGASWTPPAEETEDIKIWQSPYPARTVTTGLTSSLSFALDGWDRTTIPFALGGGTFEDVGSTVVYHPPGPGQSEAKAIFLKVLDGDVKMGVYFRKGRVISRDDTNFKPDEAALLNVEFGLLAESGQDPYNLVFDSASFPANGGGPVAATGATAGTPGTWTPSGSTAPANLSAVTSAGIIANPATAWTIGQYVATADTQHCHWDGAAWASGDAS